MKCTKEARLNTTDQAKEIVAQMSLEEKVYLMSGRETVSDTADLFNNPTADNHYNVYPYAAGGNKRLGVPEMLFCDGPRGVVTEKSTCFPVTMGRGATFDKDLERRVGEVIGKEIRAYEGNFFGGVCINLPYHPGWGRSQETYGEDSFHLGEMGKALVEGVQSHNVIACIKHYAFNSMENARFKVDVQADKRTEREVYLRHFEKCIDAGAAGVMSAYNKYDGTYCGQHTYLLRDVLKGEWDFDGFVVSDFMWGTRDTVRASNGGLDVEMCDTYYYGDKLVEAVRDGKVEEEVIDEAALRIVRTLLAFTQAEDPQEYPRKIVSSLDHIAVAKEAAEKSMTLLKNEHGTLPFSKQDTKKVAVLGTLANKDNIGDYGSSRVFPHYHVTPVEGVTNLLPEAEVVYYDGKDVDRAKEIAADSDAVIIMAGYDAYDEGEFMSPDDEGGKEGMNLKKAQGGDRIQSLGLHDHEIALIQAVAPKNKNTAVVLIGGNMIMIEEWKDAVPAIVMAYYPGMEGGTAIANTLFGDVNPGGKLPFVLVKDEADLPEMDYDADEITYEYYHGYTKLDKEDVAPSLPFGFGLSYTSFEQSDANFMVEGDVVKASCQVENTGDVAGDQVVQFYVGFKNSKVDRPVKSLRGFERITLEPGEKKTVEITCPASELAWFNKDAWEVESMDYEGYIGSSSASEDLLKGSFTVK